MKKIRNRTIISGALAVIIALGAYVAADRYLIQHVEIADVTAYAQTVSDSATGTAGTILEETSASISSDETVASTTAGTTPMTASINSAASLSSDTVTYDEWFYKSETISITISKHTSGSGADMVTWFTADVVVADATQLASAFASNQFGRNIIAYTSEIAADNNAIFAINGDYYGFRTNGIVIRNGIIYRDVPARTGLAFYLDGTMNIYDETQTSAEELLAGGVWNTLSFGPALINDGAIASNLGSVEIDTNFGNHPIQGSQPRTGIGVISPNHYVFIVVDGRSTGYSRGVSLAEFAGMFKDLGCTDAYNLDGGGSSTMYFMGRVVNNPLGRNKERGTSDILYIGPEA